jgi:hypothetical protein
MTRSIEHGPDGATLIEDGRELFIGKATLEEIDAACAAFFGPDLSMPETVPMHQVRLFLIATNRKAQVLAFLNSLPDPILRAQALEEFEYAPNFVPLSALGRAFQMAVSLDDAAYAEAVRTMANTVIEDYGQPSQTLAAKIGRFLFS